MENASESLDYHLKSVMQGGWSFKTLEKVPENVVVEKESENHKFCLSKKKKRINSVINGYVMDGWFKDINANYFI